MGKKREQGASPQLKDGYTRIANELLEALPRVRLSAYAYRVLLAIIPETYGFHVNRSAISEGRLAKITGIAEGHVHRALCELEENKIITCLGRARELGLTRQKRKRWGDQAAIGWYWRGLQSLRGPV